MSLDLFPQTETMTKPGWQGDTKLKKTRIIFEGWQLQRLCLYGYKVRSKRCVLCSFKF